MVASLSVAIPIWIRNGYRFWVPRGGSASQLNDHRPPGIKEVFTSAPALFCFSIFNCNIYLYACYAYVFA